MTFLRDVAPILNKVGCTSGPCHGAAKGKNGFKLSLRGYDPQFDYESLLYDLSGRRFNRADPGKSLMLAKPTQEVAHGGGLRFEIDSDYYKIIYAWIAQGVPFGDPAKDTVRRLQIEPKEIFMTRPGETAARSKSSRDYEDGADARRHTRSRPSNPTCPTWRQSADAAESRASASARRRCWSAIKASSSTLPVTVLNPKPGFAWKRAAAAQLHRPPDRRQTAAAEDPTVARMDDATVSCGVSRSISPGQLPSPESVQAFLADPRHRARNGRS